MEPTDFKNVIVENILPALSLVSGHYSEGAGGIFSTITFLKSVGSTDQDAL